MARKEIDNKPVTTNNNNSHLLIRSAYLEGKTELTDEDIINILDLPSEKPDYTKINIFTNKSFSEINTSETELQNIKQELIKNGDFLKYHDSYVSKSKLLYTETRTLYNELAGIIVLNEINLPSYLLPYGFAKNNKDEKTFADALQKNNNLFTEFKRVFSINSFSRAYSKAKEQSEEVFVSLNPEGMDKNETFKLLIRTINNIKSENKSCSIIFYNEKNKECYWFDINKNGFVTENEIPALKENGLAHSDKPSFAETMQQSTPSTINNIYNNKIIVNNLIFETLLDRGAILELKRNKDIYDRKEKYFNTVNHLESITAFASNDVLKKSNNLFIETEKHTQFYKNLNQNNLNTQGDKTMEKTLQTLNDYYGFSFIPPDYWNNDDISKWNEMTVKDGLNLEIVSMLDFVTEAAKVINGEKPLEYINNLDYMKLPKKIESMEELVNKEKQHRNSAYELFQKEYQIETQQNTQEVVADVEMMDANGGLSDAAIEAEFAAYENPKPDYLDEQGNPHWFDEEEETEVLADEEIEQSNEQQPVSQNKTEFEPLYFGDITENGEVNVYTKEQYFEKFGEEPSENDRLDDEQIEKWNIIEQEDNYIYSPEFIEKFGDWEKANRIDNLVSSESLEIDNKIILHGNDITKIIGQLRAEQTTENLRELDNIVTDIGKEMLQNLKLEQNVTSYGNPTLSINDDNKTYSFTFRGIKETKHHNLFQKGHIEGICHIPEIVKKSIYIGTENNENNERPELKTFHYYALGIKLDDEDYTAKIVFTETKNGDIYYDQSLSSIEKGKLVELIKENPDAFNRINRPDSNRELNGIKNPDEYYDTRLFRICQVPQMPYLERNLKSGKWQPTKEAVNLVKSGKLHVEKHGQSYSMVNAMEEPGNIISDTDKKQSVTEQSNVQDNTIPDLSDTSDIQIREESYKEIPPESESYEEFVPDFTDDADVTPGDFLPVYDGVFNVSEEDQTFLDAMDKEREEHEKWLHETKEGQKKLKEMESEVHEDTKLEGFPVSSQSESNTAKIPENLQKKAALHKFFVENAYKEKTPVPAFGYRNAKTGHIVVLEGWEFSKTETYTRDVWDEEKQEWKADDKERHGGYNSVTDDLIDGIKKQPQFIKDENGNQIENPDFYTYRKTDPIVVLTKMEGDKQIEMRIPAEQYATQIRNSCILKNAAEITEEKLQEYRQKAQLDENEQRPNNAENFTHNFTAFCRKGANSVQEAMDFAIHNLIGNMRPEEREKLKAQMLDWEKKSGKSYTERLTEEYRQNVSDKPIIDKTAFDRNVLDSIRYNTEVIDREGAKLDKSCKLTVGESVKMQLSVPDCLGRKNYKLPVQNLVLVSHCPDNNSVVLMDEKHLSKYILPRDEFIKNVQKYEKKQERSNSRTSRQEERNAISMSD